MSAGHQYSGAPIIVSDGLATQVVQTMAGRARARRFHKLHCNESKIVFLVAGVASRNGISSERYCGCYGFTMVRARGSGIASFAPACPDLQQYYVSVIFHLGCRRTGEHAIPVYRGTGFARF